MSRLILHIGPGKCGSTSIQNLFALHRQPCAERTFFYLLRPDDFVDLESVDLTVDRPTPARIARLEALLANATREGDVAILSHEFLFQTPKAMGVMTRAARSIFDDIRIIGYVRPQAGLLRSSYSQWLFRAPDRIKAVCAVLRKNEINPDFFTGLERQYIAAILDDYHSARQLSGYHLLDLWQGYTAIESASGIKPSVGALPNIGRSLWRDFCDRAGLTLTTDQTEMRANTRFHPHVVDAVTEAVRGGHGVMGPHEGNEVLTDLSSRFDSGSDFNEDFLRSLANCIDAHFSADNRKLCDHYGLDFDESFQDALGDNSMALDLIQAEQDRRTLNPQGLVRYYKGIEAVLAAAVN